ncbi:hypothetical protein Sked_26910 [Sanguibacter keddieii DSM 10542]|uniref:VOC domain-containing protein n=1 Tax=Sanguibacter keddieii (strain ATCC 51767 / DSM 10542 / NCFB 3025 / ST-74) TaxID=446469 RepID=D1BKW8_SANKS|nr:hypothetical protein [Sanguibacter keddieii]ACZ22595.1 hypothetical protein Sked_26910 [Sanguibacter keddieii DSM 10542]
MRPKAVSVGIPVRDLVAATTWYRSAFGLDEPDLQPVEGVVDLFELTDPDGNTIGFVTELA